MRVKKYSRFVALFLLVLLYLVVAFWGVTRGHRWVPLLAFLTYIGVGAILLPRLSRSTSQPVTVRKALSFVAWIPRTVGIFAALACVLAIVSYPFLPNPLPPWALAIMLLMWSVWACGCFWLAHWISHKATQVDPSQVLYLRFASTRRH